MFGNLFRITQHIIYHDTTLTKTNYLIKLCKQILHDENIVYL